MGKKKKLGKKLNLKYYRDKARNMREKKNKPFSIRDLDANAVNEMAAASTSVQEQDKMLVRDTSTRNGVESLALLNDAGNSVNILPNVRQGDSPLLFQDLDDGTVRYLPKSTGSIEIGDVFEDCDRNNHTNEWEFVDRDNRANEMVITSTPKRRRDDNLVQKTSTLNEKESQFSSDDRNNNSPFVLDIMVNEMSTSTPKRMRDDTLLQKTSMLNGLEPQFSLSDDRNSNFPFVDLDMTVNEITGTPTPKRKRVESQFSLSDDGFRDDESYITGSSDERRIVDIKYFFNELKKVSTHSRAFGCGINNLELIAEKRTGLMSTLKFKCNMCNLKLSVDTSEQNPKENLNLNSAVVSSAATVGVGYTQLQEIFSAMNIPFMTQPFYKKTDDKISEEWEKLATKEMEAAAARERECAINEGRVTDDGVPVIDVIADGCWAKRTYKKNYSSLSGAAAIIGRKFGEVLYLGVKNKYCCVCARALNQNQEPPDHKCFKNYTGSSTNMESEILVEGFKQSFDMYGIIYGKMVADGDASTYSKILEARPYSNYTVEKIECRNHLLRNMCNKLQALTKDTKYKIQDRKLLNTQRILAVRKAICLSIKHLKETNDTKAKQINELYVAISNSYNHAFSNHTKCQDFYCKSEKKSEDVTDKLKNTPLENKIKFIIGSTAANARSLIEDVDSNRCEQFNSIVAKCIGGKRVNYCLRRSYQTRCAAALVSFNTKRPLYKLQKSILGVSPKSKSKQLELRKFKKNNARIKNNVRRKKIFAGQNNQGIGDKHYGENCIKPDLPQEDYERLKQSFWKRLEESAEAREKIEEDTILQSKSSKWMEMRRNLLTASNFGKIINKRDSTNASIVKHLLYKQDLSDVTSVQHGKSYEKDALKQLAKQEKIKIKSCGLFIDKTHPFLGATPDGVIDNNRIVEIKCPITGFKTTLEAAIQAKKITFWKCVNGELVINKKHQWYYQVQGQLNITERKECLFAVWTGSHRPLKVEVIKRDENLWTEVMVPKLQKFYMESILPELLDPRKLRNMPLRGTLPPKNTQQKRNQK